MVSCIQRSSTRHVARLEYCRPFQLLALEAANKATVATIDPNMAQDTSKMRSRALSTAKFLLDSQSSPEGSGKHIERWDAANRKVIIVTESSVACDGPDLCSPSSLHPPKPSLKDLISGKSGRLDCPVSPESSPNATFVRSPGSNRNIRSSLTGYQWAGGSPTAASAAVDSGGHSSPTSIDYDPPSSSDSRRSRSIDLQRQQASCAADEHQGFSKGMARGRRHSVQFPATPEYFAKLREQPGSPDRKTVDSPEAEQAQTSKLLNGKSRRGSLLGLPTTAAVAEAADAASVHQYMSGLSFRRSRSLELNATLLDGSASMSPALASPMVAPGSRSLGPCRNSSRVLQVCTASALYSVGTAPVELAAPPSPAARGTASTAMPKGYSHQSSTCSRPALNAGQTNADSNGQAVSKDSVDVDAGFGFKPYVPSVELIDQRALEHPAESDCTHYNVLLARMPSIRR